jgi:hypothetical protein
MKSFADIMGINFGGFNFLISVLFLYRVQLTGFGQHDDEFSVRERNIKEQLTAPPCELVTLKGQRFNQINLLLI